MSSLTIFEGPDGSGKTTAVEHYARSKFIQNVTHFGPYNELDRIGHIYVEAATPAILNRGDVVFDRSWLSEVPYGEAFRGGKNRILTSEFLGLETMAHSLKAVVVMCRPPVDVCLANYTSRKEIEMLENEEQLSLVWHLYGTVRTSLPVVVYDYMSMALAQLPHEIEKVRSIVYG